MVEELRHWLHLNTSPLRKSGGDSSVSRHARLLRKSRKQPRDSRQIQNAGGMRILSVKSDSQLKRIARIALSHRANMAWRVQPREATFPFVLRFGRSLSHPPAIPATMEYSRQRDQM